MVVLHARISDHPMPALKLWGMHKNQSNSNLSVPLRLYSAMILSWASAQGLIEKL